MVESYWANTANDLWNVTTGKPTQADKRNDCQWSTRSLIWYRVAIRCSTFFLLVLFSGDDVKSYSVHKLKTIGSIINRAGLSCISPSRVAIARGTFLMNNEHTLRLFTATAKIDSFRSIDRNGWSRTTVAADDVNSIALVACCSWKTPDARWQSIMAWNISIASSCYIATESGSSWHGQGEYSMVMRGNKWRVSLWAC